MLLWRKYLVFFGLTQDFQILIWYGILVPHHTYKCAVRLQFGKYRFAMVTNLMHYTRSLKESKLTYPQGTFDILDLLYAVQRLHMYLVQLRN